MTRLTMTAALVAATLAVPSFVFASESVEADSNGDGMLSVNEVQTVYPKVTAQQFSIMDINADGALDDAEVEGATEAGLLPTATEE